MNRPRKDDETYEDYRKNLKKEDRALKYRLSVGRRIWNSPKARGASMISAKGHNKRVEIAKRTKVARPLNK